MTIDATAFSGTGGSGLASRPDRHLLNADHDDIHQTVRRATAMLEAIWASNVPSRLADVARATQLDRSTALRLLHSLEELGYVHRDDRTKTYRIGYMAQRLGARPQLIAVNLALALPMLQDLAATTGETVVAATLEGVSVLFHLCLPGVGQDRPLGVRIGVAQSAHASAFGKALLGNLSADAIRLLYAETPLTRVASRTLTDVAALADQATRSRELCVATEFDEGEEGRAALAVPVVNARGIANVAIGVVVRTRDFDATRRDALATACLRTAALIYDHVLC